MTKLSWIYDLYRLAQSAPAERDPAPVYRRLLQHVVAGFDAGSGSLAILDEDGANLAIVAGMDLPPGVVGSRVALGSGVLGWVAEHGRPLLIDGEIDAGRFPGVERIREREIPNSALCWPLKLGERVIGAVSVNRPADRPPFGDNDRDQGTALLNLVSLALENVQLQADQQRRIADLQGANRKLEETHEQLLHAEKMASIGQLAAGVAHEINTPIAYVSSNLGALERYLDGLLPILDACVGRDADTPELLAVRAAQEQANWAFVREDVRALLAESKQGLQRVRNIVADLKAFSSVGGQWRLANLNQCLDAAAAGASSVLDGKAELVKRYGDLPQIECIPAELDQVFAHLLANAAQAIDGHGTVTVQSGRDGDGVWVEVADTGKGIAPEHLKRIFDPFFTTKPVGQGTGLGLSLSYGVVKRHHGSIEVNSEPGAGSTFRVRLPVRQPASTL